MVLPPAMGVNGTSPAGCSPPGALCVETGGLSLCVGICAGPRRSPAALRSLCRSLALSRRSLCALCVGPRRSLCRGPALSVSGPGAPGASLCASGSVSGPALSRRSLCRAPALSVSGPALSAWDSGALCVGAFQDRHSLGRPVGRPPLLGLCVGPCQSLSRCLCWSACHPSSFAGPQLRPQPSAPRPRSSDPRPIQSLRPRMPPSQPGAFPFPGENPKSFGGEVIIIVLLIV